MNIKVIVASHKPYKMPADSCYLPVQVGAKDKQKIDGFTPDNTGDNISEKNPYFCELTGLYWAWKNLECDYLGLAHYRRHFKGKNRGKDKIDAALTSDEMKALFDTADIILPAKRKYYIENLYDHYVHTMLPDPLIETGKIIKEKHPEYYDEFQRLKSRTSAHMFNMYIMKKEISDGYCEWLFDILFELEKRIDLTGYDPFQARFYGRVSELLLDVYINTKGLKYLENPAVHTEKINWWKKGTGFLMAKFFGKKYEKSC